MVGSTFITKEKTASSIISKNATNIELSFHFQSVKAYNFIAIMIIYISANLSFLVNDLETIKEINLSTNLAMDSTKLHNCTS